MKQIIRLATTLTWIINVSVYNNIIVNFTNVDAFHSPQLHRAPSVGIVTRSTSTGCTIYISSRRWHLHQPGSSNRGIIRRAGCSLDNDVENPNSHNEKSVLQLSRSEPCSFADRMKNNQPLQEKGTFVTLFRKDPSKQQLQQQQTLLHNSALVGHLPLIYKSILLFLSSITTKFKLASDTIIASIKSPFLTKTPNEIIMTIMTTLSSAITARRKTMTKSIIQLTFILLALYTIRDTVQTRKRQKVDPTSEWGRYADHPSVRGMALFVLLGKMTLWVILARIVNSLPGGDYYPSLLGGRNKKGSNSSSENKDVENDSNVNQINETDNNSSTWTSQKATKIREYSGKKLADGLLKLGPLYIKIGQIVSCRDKLLPDEWNKALERLQDRVPAKSGIEAYELAYQAYDGDSVSGATKFNETFSHFDDIPLAAASLGQVHCATLRSNNATVAIKLQRSRLRDIYDKDLTLMNKIAEGVDKFSNVGQVGGVKQSWQKIFKDAETILYREIDYRDEASNAMQFASDFGVGVGGDSCECTAKSLDGKVLPSASSWMRTPFIYDDLSTEKMLVMEYVPSIKISDDKKLNEAGVTMQDREYIAECLARAYLRQFCVNKFFSTDPHFGNLGIEVVNYDDNDYNKDNRPRFRLVFYDFGQACALQDDQAGGILDVIEGIVDSNVDNCVNAFQRMGVLVDDADLDKVKSKVRQNFETGLIKVKNKKQKSQVSLPLTIEEEKSNSITVTTTANDIGASKPLTEKVDDAEIMSFFTLPAEYAFVARAISQMDGVGKSLDPDFDFISASAPYIVEIKGGERYLLDEARKMIAPILKWQVTLAKQGGIKFPPMLKES